MYLKTCDLSSKEAYLAWVAEWKTEWHRVVAIIREAKRLKNHHRDRIRNGQSDDQDYDQMTAAWGRRRQFGWYANRLIEQRLEGKRESWQRRCDNLRQQQMAG